ncbi:MAG: 5'-nucleotidase C-terminal domain-containing protein, partial [Candidatus Cloacimonetes bacterium]|nr:5'-nucleotidase C-terminal domain-containing protein [Candidatus Cloacimonadota bacterium]
GITTTDTALMSFADHIRDVEFRDEIEYLNHYVNILRNEEKVDLVIACVHAGLPYDAQKTFAERYPQNKDESSPAKPRVWGYDAQEIAHEVSGIDLMFAGHVHLGFQKPWVDPIHHTLVFQNYGYLSNLMHVQIKIDPVTKTISGYESPAENNLLVSLFEDEFIPDPDFDKVISARQAEAEKGMDEVIGVAGVHLSRQSVDAQNAMGNFVCEAMKDAVDADFSFLNLGGVRAEIPLGNVTYRHVFNAMPFDNMIVTMLIDGNMLKRIVETRVAGSRGGLLIAGGKVIFSRSRKDFDRVTTLEINGETWQPHKIYKVATTDFLLAGNAGLTLLTNIPENELIKHEINLRDAMADYFKKYSPVRVTIDDRWKRDDKAGQ